MPEQIFIGNFSKGFTANPLPFNIDNDAFPTMFNFYSWRGRAKRKRGTIFMGRLQRQIEMFVAPTEVWEFFAIPIVAGQANLITGLSPPLEVDSSIVPGSLNLITAGNVYTEPSPPDGTLLKNGLPDPGSTINYATGLVTIAGGGGAVLRGAFSYFPDLPVMGLEDWVVNGTTSKFPDLLAFDTTYAYQFNTTTDSFFNVSYYKGTNTPFVWSGADYQQFWSTNYQSAFWVTNNKPGFHFKSLTNTLAGVQSIIYVSATRVTVGLTAHGLIVGDHLFFNEVTGTIATGSGTTQNQNINKQTGIVFAVVDANTLTVDFTGASGTNLANFQAAATGAGGIAQYLTASIAGQDGIKWYDGDPTSGTGIPTGTGLGWVNFSPPLTDTVVSIDDQVEATYYLVGALMIIPFKDRLLFLGPQIQKVGGVVIQQPIQDMVLWSWNGTPYYSALVPTGTQVNETFDRRAYFVDQTGFGGYLPAGIDQPIVTGLKNEDVILIGFGGNGTKTRFVYSGNDLQPFLFYNINSEYPSCSTFSGIVMDKGGIEIGQYGITITTQQSSERFDMEIPDIVFEIQALNNGQDRVNAVRDFYREWIYFNYPVGDGKESNESWRFPSRALMLNYRDKTWALFRENYTHQGLYRRKTHYTWATLPFKTWATWREPWNAGSSQALYPSVIAGNPQGYVLVKGEGTGESRSGAIFALANDGFGMTQVTSFNHCVNSESSDQGIDGDYLFFQNAIGTITINNKIGLVSRVIDVDNFVVDIPWATIAGTYLGLGEYARLSQPLLQTKQFAVYWQEGRKVRLIVQKYLLEYTANGQVTVNINLSQDPDNNYNQAPILPNNGATNSALVYSQVVFTCPESTNIGLTPANTNLQMLTAQGSYEIWHRVNTSLIGDSFQVGITLSDTQMRDLTQATSEIGVHGLQFTIDKGPLLA